MNMKTAFAAISIVASVSLAARADAIDLNGTDRTVTDVAEIADGVTNSSATLATLTIDVSSDVTLSAALDGNVKLVKSGTGTLTLSCLDRTFTGGTEVSAGTLKLADGSGSNYSAAKSASTGAITVASGATLDLNGSYRNGDTSFPAIYAGGTGVNGGGAIVNTGNATDYTGPTVYLTADTLVTANSRIDVGTLYLQGHDVHIAGASQFRSKTAIDNSSGGDIYIEGGTFYMHNANSLGNTANKSTVHLSGATLSFYGNLAPNSDIVVENAAAVFQLDHSTGQRTISKKFTVNAPLAVNGSGTLLVNGSLFAGDGTITVGPSVQFYGVTTEGNCKYTGTIVNNKNLWLGNQTQWGALTSGIISNMNDNAQIAYVRSAAQGWGNIKAKEISGGQLKVFYYNNKNTDHGKLYISNCFVTNVLCTIFWGDLKLGTGAWWVSPTKNFSVASPDGGNYVGSTGTLTVEDGCEMLVKSLRVGNSNNTATGVVFQTGGDISTCGTWNASDADGIGLGHYGTSTTTYNMSGGTLTIGEPYSLAMSIVGKGTFNLTNGTVSANSVDMCARSGGAGNGTFNMVGGTLNLGSGGFKRTSANSGAAYAISLGGGTVKATAGFSSPLNITLTGDGGDVTFDSNGNDIVLSGVLSGAGGLKKSGNGTLTLSGANAFTGDVTVEGGSVALGSAQLLGNLVVTSNALANATAALATAPAANFASGKGIVVVGVDLISDAFDSKATILETDAAMESMPTLTLKKSDGTVVDSAKWRIGLSSDRRRLTFGKRMGLIISFH